MDISKLEHQLDRLDEELANFNRLQLSKELRPIFKQPGWTTLGEHMLVLLALESLNRSIQRHVEEGKQLVEAARAVSATGTKITAA